MIAVAGPGIRRDRQRFTLVANENMVRLFWVTIFWITNVAGLLRRVVVLLFLQLDLVGEDVVTFPHAPDVNSIPVVHMSQSVAPSASVPVGS